ncbi:class I SAM-dependent methyltransferase [Roseobacter sp. CCS2]|uniref:class I SAM-dependent methyltransferase n=1 Tax=Roseobacter sp. CCS2 TaxID=391593 RepID=UPI0000F3E487|nr:class I SAM-dependent methyltransferase [Roseobacter sp. CCS2]EBA12642.1 hypothetical protein RCCS2_15134 [Roseobacter sp. CCS2]
MRFKPFRSKAPDKEGLFHQHQACFGHLDGWLAPPAAATMTFLLERQKMLNIHGNLMELGVYQGLAATLISLHARQGEMSVFGDYHLPTDVREVIDKANAGKIIFLEKSTALIKPAEDFPNKDRSFRFIHIDAGHAGTELMMDLRLAETLLSEDGIICVDDFFNALYPQISDAVFRYIANNPYQLSLFMCGASKAFLGRPRFVRPYMEAIANDLPSYLQEVGLEKFIVAKSTVPDELNCFSVVGNPEKNSDRRRGPDWARDTFPY